MLVINDINYLRHADFLVTNKLKTIEYDSKYITYSY